MNWTKKDKIAFLDWIQQASAEANISESNSLELMDTFIDYWSLLIVNNAGSGSGDFVRKEELIIVGTELDYNELVANRNPSDFTGKYFLVQKGVNGVVILGTRYRGNDPGLYLSTGTAWERRSDLDGSDIVIDTANLSFSSGNKLRGVLEDIDVELEKKIDKDYVNTSSTQWTANSPTNINIPNGFFFNLFSVFLNTDKVASGTTSYDEYDILNEAILVPYVGKPYEGLKVTHLIRVNFELNTGSRQNCLLELRRITDDSVIGSAVKIDRNPDESSIQEIFLTYTSSINDPFVTDGFYIALVNQSGATIRISGDMGLLIENIFQKPVKF